MSKRHLQDLKCPKCGADVEEHAKGSPIYYECTESGKIFSYTDMLMAGPSQGRLDSFGGE